MKITYDRSVDMMYIALNDNYPYRTDSESIPGLNLIFDEAGQPCGIEIEDASQLVKAPASIEFVNQLELEEEVKAS